MRTEVLRERDMAARLLPRAVLMALLSFAANGWAQVPGERTSGGIVFRIGIAPGEQVSSHPPAHAESKMHASESRRGRDHVVVSLADERSGKRIGDAAVTASISRSGVDHIRRPMERMQVPEATSYGGYFDLRQPGPYRIRIEVVRPGLPTPVIADFDYKYR